MFSLDRLASYYRRKLTLPIKRGALVLDVGSGGKPHPRANVLCERFLDRTYHRSGLSFDSQGKDVVVGDVHALPFKSQSFDYVICSHVLEHVSRPADAIQELERVGRAGYIEVPSEIAEALTPNPAHRWVIRLDGRELVLINKARWELGDDVKSRINRPDARSQWRELFTHDTACVRHVWLGSIQFQIVGEESAQEGDGREVQTDQQTGAEPFLRRVLRRQVLRAASALIYPNSPRYALSKLLCCPGCRGDLNFSAEYIVCGRCRRSYGYGQQGIPRLL